VRTNQCKVHNEKCKLQNDLRPRPLPAPHFAFCILHFAFCISPFAFPILALPLCAGAGEWKVPREYRRSLTGGRDADTVAVNFCDGGHLTSGGPPPLVADEQGNLLPSRVLWNKRGGDTWVAFSATKAKGSAFVYYGPVPKGLPPAAPPPSGGWQPKLSLLLYTMPLPGKTALESFTPIANAVRAGRMYGFGFVDNIFHGLNPYGPNDDYASYYVGYLNIEKPGRYKIYTASDEASFVLLDGKPLCSWPGRHDAHGGRNGQHAGDIQLNKGQYKLEYYHAELDGEQCMMLGWTPPGAEGWHVVPGSAFVHTPVARAGWPERRGDAPLASFIWSEDDQLLYEKYQFTRVSFESYCRNRPPKSKLLWEYGDGVKSEGEAGRHIYVGDGPFAATVRIVAEDGKTLDSYSAALSIQETMKNFTILEADACRQYAEIIAKADCSEVPAAAMEALWEVIETQEDAELIRPFVETYIRRFGVEAATWQAADRLALGISVKEPERAMRLYASLAAKAPTRLDAARCQAERIEILLHKLKKPDQALALAKSIQATRGDLESRIAAVKIGDVYRALGQFEDAEKAYRDAQKVTYATMDRRTIAVRQGGYLESADYHISKGNLRSAREALVMWEIEQPIGKLSGDLILETAKYFDTLGEPDRALAECETLTKLNPLTPYLPEVEFLMGRAYKKLGNYKKARELFDKVMTEYPKSRVADKARTE